MSTSEKALPRQANHVERRRHIAEAVWRLASRGGLEEVTLRQVAAEAELPPRLLQYYFGTRNDLLLGALEILNSDAENEAKERIVALGPAPGMAAIVRTVLMELLPLDDLRRGRYLVHVAYFIRFLNDPGLRAAALTTAPGLEELIAGLITQAQRTGEADATVDAMVEADLLVAASQGLQAQLLLDEQTPQRATTLIDHQLSRIFRAPRTESEGKPRS